MDWQYTNDWTVQPQWGYPHSSRCCFLACTRSRHCSLLGGATRTRSNEATCVLPSDAARMSLGVAIPLSAKFFETMLSTPRVDLVLAVQPARAWRCLPHAPPFSMQLWQCSCTCPDDASHASNVASPASVSLQFWQCSLHVPERCLARVMTLPRRQASPRPWWWPHSGAAAIYLSSRVYVSIAILASDGGLKLLVELLPSASLLLPSLLPLSVSQRHLPSTCCCGATRQHLWFEQMNGYP